MAKYSNRKRHETGQIITTPSVYGSHKSMVVDHSEFGLELSNNEVLLKDDTHFYITKKIGWIQDYVTQIVILRVPHMNRESYPAEQDFCDLCGCSGKVYMLEDEGLWVCQSCLEVSFFEDLTNEE